MCSCRWPIGAPGVRASADFAGDHHGLPGVSLGAHGCSSLAGSGRQGAAPYPLDGVLGRIWRSGRHCLDLCGFPVGVAQTHTSECDCTEVTMSLFALLTLASTFLINPARPAPADPIVFVTSFAAGDKGGIHAYQFSTRDGKLKPLHRTAGVENPFFLALSPDGKHLYSTQAKQFGGKENEQVVAY